MATSSVYWGAHRVAAGNPCQALSELGNLGVSVTAKAGQTIVIENDPIDHYYRIISGTVRLYKAVADGRRQIIDFLGAGECFGLTGLDDHAYSVEAITDVTMIRYPRKRLEADMESDPGIGRQLFRLACSELHRAQHRMLMLGRKSAEERIASFLMDMTVRRNGEESDRTCIHLSMSRQDIADHLGLTIETVSRLFTRLKLAGLISLPDRHSVVLKDLARLSAMADGDLAA